MCCDTGSTLHDVYVVLCFCYFSQYGGKQGVAAPCVSHALSASCIYRFVLLHAQQLTTHYARANYSVRSYMHV